MELCRIAFRRMISRVATDPGYGLPRTRRSASWCWIAVSICTYWGQIQADPHASFLRGIDIGDEWDEAPFVAARRLANVLATTKPFAGNWSVVAVGDHARFIDSASVSTLRMAVAYGTNFQQGLALARLRKPKRIVLIAYSAPTAHWIGPHELDCFFSYPPCTETLDLTKAALDAAVAVGVRMDAVLIDDPTRIRALVDRSAARDL